MKTLSECGNSLQEAEEEASVQSASKEKNLRLPKAHCCPHHIPALDCSLPGAHPAQALNPSVLDLHDSVHLGETRVYFGMWAWSRALC